VPATLTGAGAAYQVSGVDASQMVVDAINQAGGVRELDGAKIRLVVQDTQGDPATTVKVMREMAGQGISAFSGQVGSGPALAAKPLIESLKIPFLTVSGDQKMTEDNTDGWVFRTTSNTGTAAAKTLGFLDEQIAAGTLKDVSKVALVSISGPPGPLVDDVLEQELTERGISVTRLSYDPAEVKDFAPTVAKLAADDVDLVMGYQYPNDGTLFAQAVSAQTWRPKGGFVFTGSPQFLDSFRKSAGSTVTGWVTSSFSSTLDDDYYTDETRKLAKDFEAKYGASMEGTAANLGATNIALIVDAAVSAKSTDPQKIGEALRDLKFSDPKASASPYYMAPGGVDFDDKQENAALIIPFIQVTPEGGVDTISPPEVATGKFQPIG